MKSLFKKLIIFGFILTSPITLVASSVNAQQSTQSKESITLSPAVSRPVVNAGDKISGKLTIINDGQTDYQFLTYARPFSVTSENYDPNYTVVNERTEAYQWVQFSQTDARLSAGGNIEIPYTVNVPQNASPGGHYAVLFAETQPPKAETSQVVRKKRVGSLLYITVNGDFKESGSLVSWNAKLWQPKKPLTAELRIKNDGNAHFQVDSTVNFKNIFGKTKHQLNQQHLVLPGTTRMLPVSWDKAMYVGVYKVDGSVKFLGKQQELPSHWVVIIPLPILIAIGGLGALGIIWYLLNRKKKAPKSKSA